MAIGPAQLVEWPLRCGPVPPLADCHSPRPETGLGLVGKLDLGDTLILTLAGEAGAPRLAQFGGSGKTQLAAALAHALWDSRAVDLLVWVSASSRDSILDGYAQALADLGGTDPDDDLPAGAQRLLTWLAGTQRRWLMVLDDLADPADLEGLWPEGTDGRVVVTARRDDALAAPNRRIVPVTTFTLREALAYLTARLTADPGQRTEALDLATDLDCQPLALALATAAMICTGASCRDYRAWFGDRRQRLASSAVLASASPASASPASADSPGAAPAGTVMPGTIDVAWSLAMDLADQIPPAGFARPMLVLAALLDPAGIPGVVFTSPAACGFLTGHPAMPADPAQAREAVHNLARAGLVTINPASTTRTVQVHPLIQAMTRAIIPPAEAGRAALSAADALFQAWPAQDAPPRLAQALRDCTASLREFGGDRLWAPEAHPVLLRAGQSLASGETSGPAIAYWRAMIDTTARVLGPAHAQTFRCRDGLAAAYEAAGRIDEAVGVHQRTLTERQRALGNDHPDTLTSCAYLARAYAAAGRHGEALPLYERVVADREWVLGARHPETLTARGDLAAAYLAAGRPEQALPVYEQTLADLERGLGSAHPDTLSARAGLAQAYHTAGQLKQAVPAYEQTLADREKAQGPDHPDTISARADLAYVYRTAGRMKHALPQYERVLADRERVLGTYHPDTLTARGNLANAYLAARRVKDAIPVYERTLTDREMAQGQDDMDTLTARGNLANAYHSAGRLKDALPLYEQTLADCERVLGPTHQSTLTSRANLASAYHAALRLTEAVTVFERTLADCELALGPDHPLTRAVRENLEAVTRT
ncbi:MAG TPA: tetratricopeptide repeat protein [Streptosporangiaceae bacterium]|nr:tetratricopeptide repeat protein [Streptosporangiaceae bacterium]